MPEYSEFSISVNPDNISTFAEEANRLSSQHVTDYSDTNNVLNGATKQALAESLNLFQQHKIYTDETIKDTIATQAKSLENENSPNNIYGKAAMYSTEREKVLAGYEKNSLMDVDRFPEFKLTFDNKDPITISELVKDCRKNPADENEQINMDIIVNHLQEKYNVKISDEQLNFIRTQLNQANIPGAFNSILAPNLPSDMIGARDSRSFTFHFVDNKLNKIFAETRATNNDGRSYSHVTEMDISNLASSTASTPKLTPTLEDYLPKHAPKEIKMTYKGNDGVKVTLSPEIDSLIKKHSNFEGQEIKFSIFSKIKNYLSELKSFFKATMSKIKNSIANIFSKNDYSNLSSSSSHPQEEKKLNIGIEEKRKTRTRSQSIGSLTSPQTPTSQKNETRKRSNSIS